MPNMFFTFLARHKRSLIILFVLFCVYNFYKGYNHPDLPSCQSSEVIDTMIPDMVAKQVGMGVSPGNVIVSKPKQEEYDEKAGLRMCSAYITVRGNMDGYYSSGFEYTIAFVDKERTQYRVDIESNN